MRVIGGTFKRTAIYGPGAGDKTIRPTHDRTRENVFNILAPVIEGAEVLDLFAGCGSVGIEALSRGARRAVFVENSAGGVKLIRKNIGRLDLADKCTVARTDAVRYLRRPGDFRDKFDVVYIDPPYRSGLFDKVIEILGSGAALKEGAVVIGEHSRKPALDTAGRLRRTETRKYSGRTTISIWELTKGEA
ncbi:16S rRNA (guanine(966)-N(2))-methyltransferase RsmD [bacterium]